MTGKYKIKSGWLNNRDAVGNDHDAVGNDRDALEIDRDATVLMMRQSKNEANYTKDLPKGM